VSPSIRFVIVGAQRTGSSALAEAIGDHPDVACGWEWTQRTQPWERIRIAQRALQGDYTALPKKHRSHMEDLGARPVVGFRRLFRSSELWLLHPRHSPALWFDRLEAHIKWLRSNGDIRIVHIVRRDDMAWLRSKALSAATGLYAGRQYPSDLSIRIPPRAALRRVAAKDWLDARLASLRETNPYLLSPYEDFLADNRSQATRVLRFLGCDETRLPESRQRLKVQSNRRVEYISNASELKALLEDRKV